MKRINTLVLDDEQIWVDTLTGLIEELPLDVNIIKATDPRQCSTILDTLDIDLITLDLMMPGITGLQLIKEIHCLHPDISIIVVSGMDNLDTAVECMQAGASDFLVKDSETPLMKQRLHRIIERCCLQRDYRALVTQYLNPTNHCLDNYAPLITRQESLKAVIGYAHTIESSASPLLIQGETGTGKRTLVNCMAGNSQIQEIHCQAPAEVILEQLLGCARGYQNRQQASLGLLHQTEGGVILLRQVEHLPLQAQIVLLDLLTSHRFSPLGSKNQLPVRARFIATSQVQLNTLVEEGLFRADLYYQLSTHQVTLPPLRERGTDLELLVPHLLDKLCQTHNRPVPEIPQELYQLLHHYPFPGNLTELSSMLTDALFYASGGDLSLLPIQRRCHTQEEGCVELISHQVVFPDPLPTISECNELLIREALRRCNGSQKGAAALLGISPAALCRRVAKL
ncbi:sigma 54-interacting transcriptional regulator [Ferrimonas sp. YFM]|uniref:sigma-54-dependent transcriptional regulator n=1 Tax=Ferrimonas sp. YFM TaxID=3028878 RepID=UPI002573AE68|nr:sigma 54-interacting transcriptional regulator [Ferrimonas sp. YFM]BDY06774.1 sigma-54-dependent Fis family transcriptional regulator [Ferrimonas sp. YFM]